MGAGVGAVRRFRLVVAEGPEPGRTVESVGDRCSIGSHPSNDLVLDDKTVSRFHCEAWIDEDGAQVRDLDSRNGTAVDGLRVSRAWLPPECVLGLGRSSVRFRLGNEVNRLVVSEASEFGSLAGVSLPMRAAFAQLERAAATDSTVLVEGETGTGKEGAARSLHDAGARRGRPFVVLDCGSVPAGILESELFGHERGAFTGATTRRTGAFEEASGGTIFLDEVGELPLELQPKLLRVLEQRQVRRLGANAWSAVDVRVVAATNRDLRAEVNAGRFRADLYFRLAVLKIVLPPLRARPDDVPVLALRFLQQLGADEEQTARLTSPEFVSALQRTSWPGNVRELRNHLERCLVFEETPPEPEADAAAEPDAPGTALATTPFGEARARVLAQFERAYLEDLMKRSEGNISRAARAAGVDRNQLYRLLRRAGMKG